MTESASAVFVYGTLKRGQERERCWPRTPQSVEPATIWGRLFDLGPYPALLPPLPDDRDQVLGELWSFAAADLPETLRALDEVECYGVDDVDLYVRQVVECTTGDGSVRAAHCYFLADHAEAVRARRVTPDGLGLAYWTASERDRTPTTE